MIGILLLHIGWRWSFAVTGFISFLYFLFFWRIYHDPNRGSKAAPAGINSTPSIIQAPAQSRQSSLGYLLRQRKVLGLALGFGSYNYVFYLLLTWLPSYLSEALHIDLLHSFLYSGVPWLFATVTDLAIGGWLVDALIRRGWNASRVRQIVLIGGTAFGLGIIGAAHAQSATRALLWISISIGGLAAAAPVGWSVPSLIAPGDSVGRVGGILNFSNQISGIAAPIITGYVVAATHSFAWAFGLSAIYLVIGIAAYIFLLGKMEQIRPETPAFI